MRFRIAAVLFMPLFVIPSAHAQSSIAQTPPMGWNSWNHFACKVTAADVPGAADAITKNGMKEAGYVYLNVDDCWQGMRVNTEAIAVDQDPKGVQGHRVSAEGPLEVWAKPLADGSVAVGFFSRSETYPVKVNFKASD